MNLNDLLIISLPYPPSVNAYWRHPSKGKLAGRHLISAEGRQYRTNVIAEVLQQRAAKRLDGRLSVHVQAWLPDRRKRDLDNLLKALFDAITHAGVVEDDSSFRDIRITDMGIERGGRIELSISPLVTN